MNYLEDRVLKSKYPLGVSAIGSLLLTLVVFYITWWVFQHPEGILRLYTPFVGYMYARWWLVVLIWIGYVMLFWPFSKKWLDDTHPLIKGTVLTAFSAAVVLFVVFIIFDLFFGHLGIRYFSAEKLEQIPKVTGFFAEEYASTAIMMVAVTASWLAPAWVVSFGRSPWQDVKQPYQGFSILFVTFSLSLIIFFVTMHPHMAILYVPWQTFTATLPPYWENFANTVSGNFHVAWIMCCSVTIWLYETIWERYPFGMIKNKAIRFFSTFFGIVVIAWSMNLFFYFLQDIVWGEAIRGTRRLYAPDWRWLHVGEIAVFLLVPALFIKFYLNNWPNKYSLGVRVLIRTLLTVAGAIFVYVMYYKYAHYVLGTQAGYSHPQQFPMIAMIWLINIWIVHNWFMDNWPFWTKAKANTEEAVVETETTDGISFGGILLGAVISIVVVVVAVWIYQNIGIAVKLV